MARPRAYILTIGIDAYTSAGLSPNYAGADADLLGERLANVPGYNVRELRLRGKVGQAAATRQAIADAIALLAPDNHLAARARLKALGVDAADFAAATSDDLVIISYAGHGWADRKGNFFLAPSDARFLDPSDTNDRSDGEPDKLSLISASALTDWLRPVDAGEAAVIIDACQSAASVAAHGFKPGPMGDRRLGQLAYNKGIRILVASRGNKKAREDPRLGHGLLTAALGRDGLNGRGFGHADIDGDGRISLDEWLRYTVMRLPALGSELAAARIEAAGRDLLPFPDATGLAPPAPDRVQQPSLFDFTGVPSTVVVGTEPVPARIERFRLRLTDFGRSSVATSDRVKVFFTEAIRPVISMAVVLVLGLVFWIVRRFLWRTAL